MGIATAAIINATGPNPVVNALDMVVLTSVSRMVAEDYLVGEQFGETAMPLLQTSRRLETNAWSLVKQVLKPEQRQELRDLIHEWRKKNPNQRYVGAIRFSEFAEGIGRTPQETTAKTTSVYSLLFLDPMAGLDPTVRAVEETRYLAERALYYAQRMPRLLNSQAELLALQLADQPAARQVLTNAGRLTASLEVFAKTAEQLPQLVNQQREAAIQQIFAGVATERSNILTSVASEEKRMREVLAETRRTLDAARDMATSVNAAVKSLDTFVGRFDRGTNPPPAASNSKPFDILDYAKTAAELGAAAKQLDTLIKSTDQSLPKAGAGAERALQRVFRLGAALIALLLGGSVLAALTYRALARRWFSNSPILRGVHPPET